MTDKPKVETIQPATPVNNVFIAPDLANAILTFLGRTQIQGQEAEAMVAAKATMQRIVLTKQPENPK